jgi:SAM-dependent methyltransferase
MHRDENVDGGRPADWSRTSGDYGRYRPDPPASFFERLRAIGIGLAGQRILDLATGTGALARSFAAAGAQVAAIDIASGQIAEAQRLAAAASLAVDFQVAAAETPPFAEARFEIATANQCWLYFDKPRALAALRRVLRSGGRLCVSHFSWLARLDPIARATETLVLAHNPSWTGADWDGLVPARHGWAEPDMTVEAQFVYDEAIPFTAESWRGRIRACRGVAAVLEEAQVAAFDRDLDRLLGEIAPPRFSVLHRLDATVYGFTRS